MAKKKDPRLARAGVSGFNKPKRTPNHPKKSHIVVAKVKKIKKPFARKIQILTVLEQRAKVAGKPTQAQIAKKGKEAIRKAHGTKKNTKKS